MKSPSTLRRNAIRKQKFLDKKKTDYSAKLAFKCNLCEFEANCKVSLRKHIDKEHKLIPQLDGYQEEHCEKSHDDKESQTDSMDVAKVVKIEASKMAGKMITENQGIPKGIPCDKCSFKADSRTNLRKHMMNVHKTSKSFDKHLSLIQLPSVETGCVYCDASFDCEEAQDKHWCWGIVFAGS